MNKTSKLLILLLLVTGCKSQPEKQSDNNNLPEPFSPPDIPAVVTDPGQRAVLLSEAYWKNFNFSDTALISHPEITEQAFVDFLHVLTRIPPEKAGRAITRMMRSATADSNMFAHFADLSEKYLYHPNSPLRDEELYVPVLRYVIGLPGLDESYKVRPRYQLEMILKNRQGDVATDFTYTLRDGKQGRLSRIRAAYTLLFFNNPDCNDCLYTKNFIGQSSVLQHLTDSGKLKIVAVYPDTDLEQWKQAEFPREWISGYNTTLSKEGLYDLKAIPTLYLLDKDKRVVLKDVSIDQVELYFIQNM